MLNVQIKDGHGSNKGLSIIKKNGWNGIPAFTEPLRDGVATGRPFLNPTFGADLNQNITFGGTPELIHNGGDSAGWTGTAAAGSWNFADTTAPAAGSAHVSITNANNLDTAEFTDATETDMSSFTAISGQIQLNVYNASNNTITLQFQNNGSPVGIVVNLNDFINTGTLGVIPKFCYRQIRVWYKW